MTNSADAVESSVYASGGAPALALGDLVLDFQTKAERYRPYFLAFLQRHRESLGLQEGADLTAAYLDRVWPDSIPGSCIVANATLKERPQWLIRPVAEGPMAALYAAGRHAPAFRVYRTTGRLVVCAFEVAPHVPPRRFEAQITAVIHTDPFNHWMQPSDLAALDSLPQHRRQTELRLTSWREYLDWKERLTHLGQIALRYDRFELADEKVIQFSIPGRHSLRKLIRQVSRTCVLAAPLSASQSPDRWVPDADRRPRLLPVGELSRIVPLHGPGSAPPRLGRGPNAMSGGSSEELVPIRVEVALSDRQVDFREELPSQGFLLSHIGGELRPIATERRAIDRLRDGRGFQPYVADWLFEMPNAAQPEHIPDVFAETPSIGEIDDDQRAAVNKAMAAPEICLILGPPGTGKSKVITEVAYQEARRGHRVLVASQANPAVDNVLARLAHRAEIRALRIAKAERVDEDSQLFLEPHALQTWMHSVQADCQDRLRQRQSEARQITGAGQTLAAIQQLVQRAEDSWEQLRQLESARTPLLQQRRDLQESIQSTEQQVVSCSRQRQILGDLAVWAMEPTAELPHTGALASERIATQLAETISRVHIALQPLTWPLVWLSANSPQNLTVCLEILHLATRAAVGAAALEGPVFEASGLCRQSASPTPDAARLRALEAQKALLADSEDENALARLAQLNREIRQLRRDAWSTVCQSMLKPLAVIFQNSIPPELEELTSSLQPENRWLVVLERIGVFATGIRDRVRAIAAEAVPLLMHAIAEQTVGLEQQGLELRGQIDQLNGQVAQTESQLAKLSDQIEQFRSSLRECRERWAELWPETRWDPHEQDLQTPEMSRAAWQARMEGFRAWQLEHGRESQRRSRLQPILAAWVDRLADLSSFDRPDVRALYLRQANVVGITCYEAGQADFCDQPDFEPFDLVIIDEVSKATPPELIAPILLGRRVILVGDHRQLPPMFKERETSFEEAAEEGLIQQCDFARYRSMVASTLFGELFEAAPDTLKHMLRRGYRSHSQIMEVVNQFYENQLVYGFGHEEAA